MPIVDSSDPRLAAYTVAPRRDRDINELAGLIHGIALDGRIVPREAIALEQWCAQDRNWRLFKEVRHVVLDAVSDGFLDEEERADILHFCDLLRNPSPYYSVATADMQRLHGILAGIAADGLVAPEEMRGLQDWMETVENIKGTWPYDEVDSLITHVMRDGHIDPEEHKFVLAFAEGFLRSTANLVLEAPFDADLIRHGICAMQPEVSFRGKVFCVTGTSPRASRREIEAVIAQLGGKPHPRVVNELDYLVVAAERTYSWAFSCYGRKVEAAMKLRRAGVQLTVVHESDFWDAAEDNGVQRPALRA